MNDLGEEKEEEEEREGEEKAKSIIELPKDLVKKLMFEYFDALSVVRCLQTSKILKNLVPDKELGTLRIKAVKQTIIEKQIKFVDTYLSTCCRICGAIIAKESMIKHLEYHERSIKRGEIVVPSRFILDTNGICALCDAPGPDCGPHRSKGCPLKIIECNYYLLLEKNLWAEFACPKIKGYAKQMNGHKCAFRCKSCKELFPLFGVKNNKDESSSYHLKDCQYKTEIIKY